MLPKKPPTGSRAADRRVLVREFGTHNCTCPHARDYFFAAFTHESFRVTVRLKTGLPGAESGSALK